MHPWRTWEILIERHPYLFCVAMAFLGLSIHPDLDMLWNVILSFAMGSCILIVLKRFFKVKRGGIVSLQGYRFPSFHSGIASTLSFTVMLYHIDIGIPFLTLAIGACAARVTSRDHTIYEVIGGFSLGPLIAFLSWCAFNWFRWW